MTIYALDPGRVHRAIRDALADRVLPSVEADAARGELLAVIEMLDALESRLAWNPAPLAAAVSRTRTLGEALGQVAAEREDRPADDLDALRVGRRLIGEALASAYADGSGPAVAGAVAAFTAADVTAEISHGLRAGLPD